MLINNIAHFYVGDGDAANGPARLDLIPLEAALTRHTFLNGLTIEADGTCDSIAVGRYLYFESGTTLELEGTFPASGTLTILTYGVAKSGAFSTVTGLPAGWSVVYTQNGFIKLVK